MKTRFLLILLSFYSGVYLFASDKMSIRRHFVIAYDISGSFKKELEKDSSVNRRLIELFEQGRIEEAYEKNDKELTADTCFFDPLRDEISFYPFGITGHALQHYWDQKISKKGPEAVIAYINQHLVQSSLGTWSECAAQEKVGSFLQRMIGKAMEPTDFGKGITLSYLVHPFIINHLDTSKVAEDYVLIVLSDFKMGVDNSNQNEFALVDNVFGPENREPIVNYVNNLKAYYKQVPYFHYTWQKKYKSRASIRLAASHIEPAFPLEFPIVSPITLTQNSLWGEAYTISDVTFRWKSAKPASIHSIGLHVEGVDEEEKIHEFFSSPIARLDSTGQLRSNYAIHKDFVRDSLGLFYQLPVLSNVTLKGFQKAEGYKKLNINYSLLVRYDEPDIPRLGYISRSMPYFLFFDDKCVQFQSAEITDSRSAIFIILCIAGIGIVLLGWLWIRRGRIVAVELIPSEIGEDFVRIQDCVRKRVKYYPFRNERQYTREIEFETIPASKRSLRWKWPADLVVRLEHVQVYCIEEKDPRWVEPGETKFEEKEVDVLRVSLYPDDGSTFGREANGDLRIHCGSSGKKFGFKVRVEETPAMSDRNKVYDIHYELNVQIKSTLGRISSGGIERQSLGGYDMAVGPALHNYWIGFDPGTTATCMAVKNTEKKIILCDFKKKEDGKSYPFRESLLLFHTPNAKDKPFDSLLPDTDYRQGPDAYARWHLERAGTRFQSIKKLLSQPDLPHEISWEEDGCSSLTGLQLAQLLVRGVYHDFKKSTVYTELEKESCVPRRAVVAVPNSFTMVGIQAMVDSVRALGCFEEVDYIFEATAVVCYYLSHPAYTMPSNGDRILVFDMGGATINASVFQIEIDDELGGRTTTRYRIRTLGKVGYGIGGDTIDYFLLTYLLEVGRKYSVEKISDIAQYMKKNKHLLLKEIATFKKISIQSNENLPSTEVERLLKKIFPSGVKDNPLPNTNSDFTYIEGFIRNEVKKKSDFDEFVYKNVASAIRELMHLPKVGSRIDRIIYSGRSTIFPGIREKVEETVREILIESLGKIGKQPEIIYFQTVDELKAAVSMGACWCSQEAGRLLDLVDEENSNWIGVKRTTDKLGNKVEFDLIVSPNDNFSEGKIIKESVPYEPTHDFLGDDNKVKFYQVFGIDYRQVYPTGTGEIDRKVLNEIFAEKKYAYKYVELASFDLNNTGRTVEQVKVELDTKGNISCYVRFSRSSTWEIAGMSSRSDREIVDSYADHYRFSAYDY